jgi:hypothetical protein
MQTLKWDAPCPPYIKDANPALQIPVVRAKTMTDIRFRSARTLIHDVADDQAIFSKLDQGGQFPGGHDGVEVHEIGHGSPRMAVYGTSTAIAKGKGVMADSYFNIKQHTGLVRDKVIGVAMQAVVDDPDEHAVLVWFAGKDPAQGARRQGRGHRRNDPLIAVNDPLIAVNDPLIADTSNAGSFCKGTSVADANYIGRALEAWDGTGGPRLIQAELFLAEH